MPSPLPLPEAPEFTSDDADYFLPEPASSSRWRTYALHLLLFVVTLITTTLAGAEWITGRTFFGQVSSWPFTIQLSTAEMLRGLWFSVPFLGVLTVHEFGHYFTAGHYRVRATLPFYIPFFTGVFNTIGTFGAVIRIKDRIFSRKEFFDIGLAGPLAGFLVAVPVLIYGFTHLPPLEYIFQIHPEYRFYGAKYAHYVYRGGDTLALSRPLIYSLLEKWLANPARIPHPNELMHYPVLLAGLMALFFTALNLLPIGQLDGGHILYGLLGYRRFNRISLGLFIVFIFYAGLGLFTLHSSRDTWLYWSVPYLLYLFLVFQKALPTPQRGLLLALGVWAAQLAVALAIPGIQGNPGWLVFGLLLGRVTGIFHPPAPDERPLSTGRKVLGWVMLVIFVLCFSPSPFG
ncbi:site-2 protease family protein [Hymenobacter sp. GOD-10R]|uniref:site-2 protease family protein n=1 Tax=Hymenobacter sp. GOD-10R TaxID=3093922 RepID=UPI002D77E195|nr:site-2 protease family protein [Hymenobacter sp. GOD-10R]WRQ27101.1 site-2 protease family protein [Hymenobacter sp. GOD-10R]